MGRVRGSHHLMTGVMWCTRTRRAHHLYHHAYSCVPATPFHTSQFPPPEAIIKRTLSSGLRSYVFQTKRQTQRQTLKKPFSANTCAGYCILLVLTNPNEPRPEAKASKKTKDKRQKRTLCAPPLAARVSLGGLHFIYPGCCPVHNLFSPLKRSHSFLDSK